MLTFEQKYASLQESIEIVTAYARGGGGESPSGVRSPSVELKKLYNILNEIKEDVYNGENDV